MMGADSLVGGRTVTSSDEGFEVVSPRRFFQRLIGTTSFCSIILFSFSLFSLAVAIPAAKEMSSKRLPNQNTHKQLDENTYSFGWFLVSIKQSRSVLG
jgi:hypothetical protein